MAYQNCNVNKLQSALNTVDNISYEKIEDLIGSMNSNDWESKSNARIKNALREIVNEYKTIQKKINNYKEASNYIEEYQEVEDDYNNYRKKVDKYKDKLSNCDKDDLMYNFYDNKLDSYNSKVSNNKSRMSELMRKINNLVN